jgi:2,3-dihydro-2,3-dihydroxybenzoate dehydrogenase
MELTGLAGRVVLVTGAAGGIGSAIADAFAQAGSQVVLADIVDDAIAAHADRLTDAVGSVRPRVHWRHLDVGDERSVEEVVTDIETRIGPIAILAHAAGVLGASRPVLETETSDWDRVYSVNVRGSFLVCRAVARTMVPRRQGRIVVIASNTARVVRMNQSGYGSSKAALLYLTKALGLELAQYGIRCNVVNPGTTRTPMATARWSDPALKQAQLQGDLSRYRVGIPLGRLAEAEDIANAVMFLSSDQSAHITAADLLVDGASTLNV